MYRLLCVGLITLSILPNMATIQYYEEKKQDEKELTDAIFPRTDPKTVGLIYQMLKVIDLLFTNHNIKYWIDGGTALGAVRHQGCIPWDDDADLVFHIEDEERILALTNEFAIYGFDLRKKDIFRLYPSQIALHPCIDLAGYKLYEDNTYRFDLEWAQLYFSKFYWLPHEIETLTRVKFGPLMLNAPKNMLRYLFTGYGEDCLSNALFQTHHGGEGSQIVIKNKVQVVNFSAAEYEIENLQILLD